MKAFHLLPILPVLLSACAGTQNTTALHDGVYDKPSFEPVAAAAPAPEATKPADDYYDPKTAGQYQHGYYDMAYNDPYYYNYGRFGFGTSLNYGYGSNYGSTFGSNWNMGYGYGAQGYDPWGSHWNNGWGSPFGGYGSPYGGYGSPYGGYYGSPYGGCCGSGYWNDPWNNGYSGYSGYGYYGYGGGCYSCYQPIVVCGNPGVVAHRPSLGSGGGGGTGGGTDGSASVVAPHLSYARSMVSLRPAAMRVLRPDLYATRPVLMEMPAGQRTDHMLILERNAPPREANGRDNGGRVRDGGRDGGTTIPMRTNGGGDSGGGRTVNEHRPR